MPDRSILAGENKMKRRTIALTFVLIVCTALATRAVAQSAPAITEEAARAIGVDAYLYL